MEAAKAIMDWTFSVMPYLIGFDLVCQILIGAWVIWKAVQLSAKKLLLSKDQGAKG